MQINHGQLDTLLGKVLDTHAAGEVSRNAAIGAIAHVVAAVAQGNETEVKVWLADPAVFDRWLKDARA